jgi:hypothetical protein
MQSHVSTANPNALQVVTLTKKQYVAMTKGHDEGEIRIRNRMYDIASVEYHDDSVTIRAVHDELEDNLLAIFRVLVSGSRKNTKRFPVGLLKSAGNPYLISIFNMQFQLPDLGAHDTTYLAHYHSPESNNHTPPPRRS